MPDGGTTHLFTERGALCGAWTYSWSLAEATVSCAACRALIEVRAFERRQGLSRRDAIALARLLSTATELV